MKNFWKQKLECDPKPHSYDKTKIFIEMGGIKRNVYDLIQDGRVDVEIYPTLEKYGCIDKMPMDTNKVYGELNDITDMRDAFEAEKAVNKLWLTLPVDERAKFNHDVKEFYRNGEKYLATKLNKDIEQVTKPNEQQNLPLESEATNE